MMGHSESGMTFVYTGVGATGNVGYYRRRRSDEPAGLIVFSSAAANDSILVCNVNTLSDEEELIQALIAQRRASRHLASVLFKRPQQIDVPRRVPPTSALIRWMAKALIGGQK